MPNRRTPNVVFDSVVMVSAFLTQKGLTASLITLCGEMTHIYTAEEILQETRRVLLEEDRIRRKYTYRDEDIEEWLAAIREMSTVLTSLPALRVVERDPKDDMIIACAVASQADYIISRDRDLLDLGAYQGIEIVTPEAFIHYLRRAGELTDEDE